MRRFRALIKKELTHVMRDPRTLVFIFLMPIMQLVLLGYINTTEIRHVSTVVFNQDNEKASRDLLDSFNATDYFSFDNFVNSQAEVYQAIDGGKTIIEFMRDAKAAGVKFYLCRPALPGYEIEVEGVIEEVDEFSSGGELADMILSCDKALFF